MNNEHTSYNMIIYYNDHNQYGGNFPDFARNLILQSLFSSIHRQNKKKSIKNFVAWLDSSDFTVV